MIPLSLQTLRKLSLVLVAVALMIAIVRESIAAERTVALSSDGIPIAYESLGSGATAIIFVHGWSCNRSYWKGQLEAFTKQFKVVTLDLAGHGESGAGRKKWTIDSFGDDVAAVVKELDLRRVILVGHSMGGDVIVDAARRLPGRVVGLVWVEDYRQLGSPRTDAQAQAFLAPFRADFVKTTQAFVRENLFAASANKTLVERVAAQMSSAPPAIAIDALESSMTNDRKIPSALEALKLPIVAINADYQPTDIESMQRHGVEVVVAPRASHFLMMENPKQFNAVLLTVINKMAR